MHSVKLDFSKRQSEVEEYLNFVTTLTSEVKGAKLKYNSYSSNKREKLKISDQLQKVLIANGFLLLYNLIEATMRNSLSEIFDKVSDDGLDYGQLSQNLKEIWISHSTKNLSSNFKSEKLTQTVQSIADSVLDEETITLDKDKLDFSGNLDARKIRSLAAKYGFNQTSMNAENLATIKNKRNYLAHGDYSFSEIGKDYSSGDLKDFKNETIAFLSDVIIQIETYIRDKKYLRPTGS